MKIELPFKIRATLYALNILGTPVMAYLLDAGVIGPREVSLWAAEMTAVFTLAGLNLVNGSGPVPEVHDVPFEDETHEPVV